MGSFAFFTIINKRFTTKEVMKMLKETDWNTISNILLELYTIDNIDELSQKLMKVLQMLIPYSKGYFILLDDDQNIIKDKSYFSGMEMKKASEYIDTYYDKDYLKYLYEFSSETIVFKDTDILEDKVREQTDIYRNFFRPSDISYGCGIMIIRNDRIIGIFSFFRNKVSGDFTDKDIYVLNILKRHIENMVYNVTQMSRAKIAIDRSLEEFARKYELTLRETEVVRFLNKGCSNQEIADNFMVSLSTVKKHIYNLYNKTSVSSRSQLIALLFETEKQ